MNGPKFSGDVHSKSIPFPHYWEHTVGSGHATLALRADWQKQILRAHQTLGFEFVRFHGVLHDDMSTLVNQDDQLIYSFFNLDQIFDYLVSIGMKPFIELSFMPKALASGDETVFHYAGNITPPKDPAAWGTLIEQLAHHLVERYGLEEVKTWFFEVWNEPNLKAFWTGTQAQYFELYQVTAQRLKKVSPLLKVGGPATSDNKWIPEFLNFCKSVDAPVDFISTHHYPTDAFGKPGDDTETQLAASHRSILRDEAVQVVKDAQGLPVYYTEWSSSSNPFDLLHDQPFASAFIAKTVMEARGLLKGYSFWTFSDIFEENYFSSIPFHGGFGLVSIYGIPKPSFRAYELLHALGDQIYTVEGSHPTVDVWLTRFGHEFKLLIVNSNLPRHPLQTETIQIELKGVHAKNAKITRIDDEHANATEAWKKMGSPRTLSKDQVEILEHASELKPEPFEFKTLVNGIQLSLSIPPQGIASISLETQHGKT